MVHYKGKWCCLSVMLGLGAITQVAKANEIQFTLSNTGCVGCTVAPFALIDVESDPDGMSVDLAITMGSDGHPYLVHEASDTNHWALAFNLTGEPTITVATGSGGTETEFTLQASPGSCKVAGVGDFEYAFTCGGCTGSGYSGGMTPTQTIKITPSTGTLDTSSFIGTTGTGGSAGKFFAMDIVDFAGNTGNIWDPGDPGDPVTPEPVTLLLTGSALVAMAFALRKRGLTRK